MCLFSTPVFADFSKFRYITEEYPPHNFWSKDKKVTGISVDILNHLWHEMGIQEQPIEMLPWARGYRELEIHDDVILFSVAKTAERSPLFQWACPIAKARYVLIAKKSSRIKIHKLKDIEQYQIGTIRSDVSERVLLEKVGNLDGVLSNVSMRPNLELMDRGRIQLIAYDDYASEQMLLAFDKDPKEYESVFEIGRSVSCFAFNRNVDPAIVASFQQRLSLLAKSPAYKGLLDKYAHFNWGFL